MMREFYLGRGRTGPFQYGPIMTYAFLSYLSVRGDKIEDGQMVPPHLTGYRKTKRANRCLVFFQPHDPTTPPPPLFHQ